LQVTAADKGMKKEKNRKVLGRVLLKQNLLVQASELCLLPFINLKYDVGDAAVPGC
jgi:hypothetical protein